MAIRTLADLLFVIESYDKSDCLMHKVDGRYRSISSRALVDRVQTVAASLVQFGVEPGDRVALMAENGPHWPTVDFAALGVGAVLVPVYPTLTSDQAAYVVNDCGAEIALIQGRERLDGLLEIRDDMPAIKNFVLIEGEPPSDAIKTLDSLTRDSAPMPLEELKERASRIKPEDLATFIYTSGTTGNPKGVMLTHENIASNVEACLTCLDIEPHQTALSFLPLSHSFERTIDYIYFRQGVTVAYAESVQTVAQNFGEVRPHVFVSVPRVYEKVLARVRENVSKSSPLKRKIFSWAVSVAKKALPYRLTRKTPPGFLGFKLKLADKLVFGKIKERLGGRFEVATSGGAPLARDVAEFFWGAGIEIYEGYGLSETSPVLTVNRPGFVKMGTVGRAIPGVTLKIADDGEILAKGPNIMKGYHNLAEKTAEAIDAEGWFHTGDIGEIDEEGFLRITDRKKEIIVNAYGKNVAPAPIEGQLKASQYIEQAVVIGDRRKFLSALLVPDFATLEVWAGNQGLGTDDRAALLADSKVQELFAGEVRNANKELAKYERIHAWELLSHEFTIESGELTPTQKIKRRVINQKYGEVIEQVYRDAEAERSA
ncbi:MAG: long-chain fatty acid--CoA ligase [bacterium]|nr:long-chain fatty acid--CoA ligase [bacterium]